MQNYRNTKANWPITLKELIARRNQLTKGSLRQGIGFLIIILSYMITLAALGGQMEHNNNMPIWLPTAGIVLYIVIILGIILLHRNRNKKKFRSYDLICSSCSIRLEMVRTMSTVVATGRCPNCGAQLVSDHPTLTSQQ